MGLKDPDEFMARLTAGFSLTAAISGKYTPDGKRRRGVGSREGFQVHCREFPEWGRKAMAQIERNAAAAQKRKGGGRGDATHCKRGHPFSGENLVFRKRSSGRHGFVRYCKICQTETQKRGGKITPSELRRVTAAVKAGFNIQDITRSTPARRLIVTFTKLKRYRVEHPEFDRFIIENVNNANSRSKLLKCQIVPANAQFVLAAPTIIKPARKEIPPFLMRDDDLPWVLSLIPRSVPDQARYDVLQDVFVALSAREISREEVPRMVRQEAAKYLMRESDGRDPRNPWSLDAPAYREGNTTRGDTLSRGLWD